MEQTAFSVSAAESEFLLDIEVTVRAGGHFATVRAVQEHTNIVLVETDAGVLFSKDPDEDTSQDEGAPDYTPVSSTHLAGKHAAVPAFAHLGFIARGEPGRFLRRLLSFRGEHGRIRKNAGNGEERENAAWNERARSTKPMWRF